MMGASVLPAQDATNVLPSIDGTTTPPPSNVEKPDPLKRQLTDKEKRARGGISAFLVDKGTPGFNVLRRIPMIGGAYTY